ncbi:BadF/BadG/BcrA/BcrD ATPase family protein [Afifella pfennigii]|uniref:BadF/BadG/BcrA/BcrD ATPase family protein n=1 Tax=Afifella pfennigii TaxID=209897 RepID=UPI00068A5867|nr:BadF/BadG/BcrA/BcrD ATPase family protein [Afifella pfennigii]
MGFILSIDAGGSACRGRLTDPEGKVLAKASGGPANPSSDLSGALASLEALIEELAGALDPQPRRAEMVLAIAAAGLVDASRRDAFLGALSGFARLVAMTDGYAALVGASGGRPATLLALGTGAVGHRLFADGTSIQRDGWGFLGGDRGSGAWLGRRAIELALRSFDGAAPPSLVSERIIARLGGEEAPILAWLLAAGARDCASLVPEIVEAAGEGDEAALALLDAAGEEVAALLRALGPESREPVYCVGGLAGVLGPLVEAKTGQLFAAPQGDALHGARLVALGIAPQELRG